MNDLNNYNNYDNLYIQNINRERIQNKNKKKNVKKKVNLKRTFLLFMIIILSIILVTIIASSINFGYHSAKIEVPQGASTKQISVILEENKIISNRYVFQVLTKLHGYDGKYRQGVFEFNTDMKMTEIMNELASGGKDTRNTKMITIPEGYTLKQIAELFEEKGFFSKEEFLEKAKNFKSDYEFLKDVPAGNNYLEGYLFPNTYQFYENSKPEDVIKTMLKSFNEHFSANDIAKAKELGYSYHEIITVASIIEREVRNPNERAKVAGVIYNRLKIGQSLEMCSTIQYILGKQQDKIYDADLKINSPYNTYMYPGLPIGPISNPGEASINAALNPEVHDYYYFVLMDEKLGTHYFSKTFNEHVNAKNKYLK